MYRYELEVLETYGIHTDNLVRGRGAWICETEEGLKILQEYPGSVQKLIWQKLIQEKIEDADLALTDMLQPNLEGELYSRDRAGTVYTLRNWYKGRECDTHSLADIRKGARLLAQIHSVMKIPFQKQYAPSSLYEECLRHNREMKRTAKYLRQRKQKNIFEELLTASIETFIRQGESALAQMETHQEAEYRPMCENAVCHGDFSQHNLLFSGPRLVVIGFQHWNFEPQSADLYRYIRKILEKNDWDSQIFEQILTWYQDVRPLDETERMDLYLRLAYPWKNWKLVNYYMQNPKTLPPKKNMEKMTKILRQQKNWCQFVQKMTESPVNMRFLLDKRGHSLYKY